MPGEKNLCIESLGDTGVSWQCDAHMPVSMSHLDVILLFFFPSKLGMQVKKRFKCA